MSKTIASELAGLFVAIENCEKSGNVEWRKRHAERILAIMDLYAPSGSGIDNGVKLLDGCNSEKLVFKADFHHMNEHGSYDGWTEHTVTCTASLAFGLDIKISGQNRNHVKVHLTEIFYDFLSTEVNEAMTILLNKRVNERVGE